MCHINQPLSREPIASDAHLPEFLLKSLLQCFSEAAVFAIDREGSYIFFNDRYNEMIQSSSGVKICLGMQMLDCTPEYENRKAFRACINRALAGEIVITEFKCHASRESLFEVSFLPVKRADEATGGVIVIAKDITLQKELQTESLSATRLLINIVNSSTDYIFVKDRNLRTILCNEAFARTVGKRPEDCIGKTDLQNGWNEECVKSYESDDLATLSGKVVRNPRDIVRIGHQVLIFDTVKIPLKYEDGSIYGILGISRDVTELLRAEDALEKRIVALTRPLDDTEPISFEDLFNIDEIQQLQDDFARATGVATIITRPDGRPITRPANFLRLCSQMIRQTSRGLENCFKSAAEIGCLCLEGPRIQRCRGIGLWNAGAGISVGGRHIANWLIGQVRDETQNEEEVMDYARKIGIDEKAVIEAFREVPVMPREKFASIAQMLFTLAKQLSNTAYQNVQQARFITERKKIETEREKLNHQLNQMQKLESLGVLAGGVAHDFNNLLAGIFGYIDLARISNRDQKVGGLLNNAMSTIERARDLTRQLLTFSKGGEPIKKTESLMPFMQKTAMFALSGSDASISFSIPENLWLCDFDRNQIGQVIDNLIINAIQAMPQGGMITVAAKNLVIERKQGSLAAGKYLKISISDQGTGIPQKSISMIFDPFFTTKPRGHGLGLSTCYSIIKRHDGMIEVESEEGKGATFHIYLPASRFTIEPALVQTKEMHTGTGTFIILDDEIILLETTGQMLESFGYSPVLFEDGKDAVSFFINELQTGRKPAGVLLDLTVPGCLGGKKAVAEIRRHCQDIPVFVVSGYAEDPVMANPQKYGFSASICKPFSISALAQMLNKYIIRETED